MNNNKEEILPFYKNDSFFGQIKGMVGMQLITYGVTAVLTLAMLIVGPEKTTIRTVLTWLNFIIYIAFIFSKASQYATFDHKPYHKTTPHPLKGFPLSIGMVVFPLICYALYTLAWRFIPTTDLVYSPLCTLATLLYIFASSPVFCYVNVYGNSSTFMPLVYMLIATVIACGTGYYAGYKKIDIVKIVNDFMIEKNK